MQKETVSLDGMDNIVDDLEYQQILDQWLDNFSNQLQLAASQLGETYPELVSQLLFVLVTSGSDSPTHAANQLTEYAAFLNNKVAPLHELLNGSVH